jgi:predicted TIM-barrel fold metal-dependent hydrolase
MIIDVHSHIYPRDYLNELSTRNGIPRVEKREDGEHFVIFEDEEELLGSTRPMPASFYDLTSKIDFMDNHGIDRTIVSIGNPWVDFFSPDEAGFWATKLNNWLQQECEREARFEAFGVLPIQTPGAAVVEIERIARLSHIHGVIIGTRPDGQNLDSPALEPVWAALERHQLMAFIHPHYVLGYDWMNGYGHALPLALGFTFETTTAITRLILSGVLDRFPALRLLLAHGGGTLPYLSGRLEICTSVDGGSTRHIQQRFGEYLKKLYYDTVVYDPEVLRLTLTMADATHYAFGTDHPFGIANPDLIRSAIDTAALTPAMAKQLFYENATNWVRVSAL